MVRVFYPVMELVKPVQGGTQFIGCPHYEEGFIGFECLESGQDTATVRARSGTCQGLGDLSYCHANLAWKLVYCCPFSKSKSGPYRCQWQLHQFPKTERGLIAAPGRDLRPTQARCESSHGYRYRPKGAH